MGVLAVVQNTIGALAVEVLAVVRNTMGIVAVEVLAVVQNTDYSAVVGNTMRVVL